MKKSPCCNAELRLLRFDVGAGGIQARAVCTRCWARGKAISHQWLREHGIDINSLPPGDIDLLRAAERQQIERPREQEDLLP